MVKVYKREEMCKRTQRKKNSRCYGLKKTSSVVSYKKRELKIVRINIF